MSESAKNLTDGSLLARNTLYSLVGQAVPVLAAIFSIPILINALGAAGFGVLALAWMVTGYFGVLDLGVGRALTKMLSEKLFDWTGIRWLISFSSEPGNPTIKEISKKNKSNLIIEEKKKSSFKELKKILPDLELIDIITEDNND